MNSSDRIALGAALFDWVNTVGRTEYAQGMGSHLNGKKNPYDPIRNKLAYDEWEYGYLEAKFWIEHYKRYSY